jgi:hypothetical protein
VSKSFPKWQKLYFFPSHQKISHRDFPERKGSDLLHHHSHSSWPILLWTRRTTKSFKCILYVGRVYNNFFHFHFFYMVSFSFRCALTENLLYVI